MPHLMSQINQYLLKNSRALEFFDFPLLFPYFMLFLPGILFPLHGWTPNVGHFSCCCCFLLCSLHMLVFIYMFTIFCSLLFLTHHFFHVQFPSSRNTSVSSSFMIKLFKLRGKYLLLPLLEQNSTLRMFFSQD